MLEGTKGFIRFFVAQVLWCSTEKHDFPPIEHFSGSAIIIILVGIFGLDSLLLVYLRDLITFNGVILLLEGWHFFATTRSTATTMINSPSPKSVLQGQKSSRDKDWSGFGKNEAYFSNAELFWLKIIIGRLKKYRKQKQASKMMLTCFWFKDGKRFMRHDIT